MRSLLEERACVLFNVAATYSQLGALQDVWSRDGLRQAAAYFQVSAGASSAARATAKAHAALPPSSWPRACSAKSATGWWCGSSAGRAAAAT
jgi:programmed cell death 6-interacting protein